MDKKDENGESAIGESTLDETKQETEHKSEIEHDSEPKNSVNPTVTVSEVPAANENLAEAPELKNADEKENVKEENVETKDSDLKDSIAAVTEPIAVEVTNAQGESPQNKPSPAAPEPKNSSRNLSPVDVRMLVFLLFLLKIRNILIRKSV